MSSDFPETDSPTEGVYQGLAEVTIRNTRGLHARAAAKLANIVAGFDADVSVYKDGRTANGGSIMALLTLGAAQGTTIIVETNGPDAEEALEAIVSLVEAGFHEDGGLEDGDDDAPAPRG